MKIKLITIIASVAFLPIAGFSQTPPAPPQPPAPPRPPAPGNHEKAPKVPTIFLGVETAQVPSVVSEQLGLSKGLGLVVEYVVPNSPAATAGIQQNDIIKLLNDQILIEPSQLRKLLQTFSDGTDVTLTILRKGQEQKVTVKLSKKEMPQRHAHGPGDKHDWDFDEVGDLGDQMQQLKEQLHEQLGEQRGMIRETVTKAHEAARRAREDARRAAREIRILSKDNGALKATRIDLGKAQIVFSDEKGEMKLENVDGKKLLTVKDPQGKLVFSGPAETKEDMDKMPADVRERYEKLQQNDLPAVAPETDADQQDEDDNDEDDEATQSIDTVSSPSSFQLCVIQGDAWTSTTRA